MNEPEGSSPPWCNLSKTQKAFSSRHWKVAVILSLRLKVGYLFRCRSVLSEIRLPRSFQGCRVECSGIDVWSKWITSSVFPPRADERSTARNGELFQQNPTFQDRLQLRIRTTSHSLHVVPFSFLLSSFLRTTATCANVGCLRHTGMRWNPRNPLKI